MQKDAFEQDSISAKELDNALKEDPKTNNTMDYKLMVDMIKEMDQQYKDFQTSISENIKESYGIKPSIMEDFITIKKSDITMENVAAIRVFLANHAIDEEARKKYEGDEKISDEDVLEVANTLKGGSNILLESKQQADEVRRDAKPILDEYFSYLSSDKYIQIVKDKIDMLNAAIALEEDPLKRSEMEKQIKIISSTIDHSYLLRRFNKYGESEIKSIADAYFDNRKSKYIMERYKDKITKVGFNENIYVNFLNIEENFLPEKYSVFNNLFLFIYTRMIAYTDVYDRAELTIARSATSSIAKLIYHKYDNLTGENEFKSIIMNILDKFESYRDKFDKDNITHPNHPVRIAHEEEHEKNRKEALINSCKRFNISLDDIDVDNISADKLQEYFNEELDKLSKRELDEMRKEKEEKENDNPTESADGKSPLGVVDPSPDVSEEEEESKEEESEVENNNIFDLSSMGIQAINSETGEPIEDIRFCVDMSDDGDENPESTDEE